MTNLLPTIFWISPQYYGSSWTDLLLRAITTGMAPLNCVSNFRNFYITGLGGNFLMHLLTVLVYFSQYALMSSTLIY